MKATGIVRRIDRLGQVNIPREIRTTVGICAEDPLEIFLDGNNVVLQKYHSNSIHKQLEELRRVAMSEDSKLCDWKKTAVNASIGALLAILREADHV